MTSAFCVRSCALLSMTSFARAGVLGAGGRFRGGQGWAGSGGCFCDVIDFLVRVRVRSCALHQNPPYMLAKVVEVLLLPMVVEEMGLLLMVVAEVVMKVLLLMVESGAVVVVLVKELEGVVVVLVKQMKAEVVMLVVGSEAVVVVVEEMEIEVEAVVVL